jgi:hypothetical protein
MKISEKIYWSKIFFAIIIGFICYLLKLNEPTPWIGILFTIFVYIIFSRMLKNILKIDLNKFDHKKLYTIGIGSFFIIWLVVWILLYSLFYI